MDSLSEILKRFNLHAEVFFSGNLCNLSEFHEKEGKRGHIHILRSGALTLVDENGKKKAVGQPSVLFFPTGRKHRILPDPVLGADLVCATIEYQDVTANPLAAALPGFMKFQLSRYPDLKKAAKWLFKEAFSDKPGRLPLIDRLCDIFIIQVLRQVLASNEMEHGMLAGLSHPQLCNVITQIHAQPEYPWSLETMSELAFMSRSKFADLFREVVGETPGEYLTNWRMTVAQNELLKGDAVSTVAEKVGYENGSALARAFRKKTGLSPKHWQQEHLPE
uniref:AraC family transcriptional regulator n=1 Tax=Ningiella ruwaisensis TaxID=2364274 RepID=UPI00109F27F1|nr:AraC family transcriptional regulator [Ningiella ruwaisensis]